MQIYGHSVCVMRSLLSIFLVASLAHPVVVFAIAKVPDVQIEEVETSTPGFLCRLPLIGKLCDFGLGKKNERFEPLDPEELLEECSEGEDYLSDCLKTCNEDGSICKVTDRYRLEDIMDLEMNRTLSTEELNQKENRSCYTCFKKGSIDLNEMPEDDDEKILEPKTNFMCNWFGIFCPKLTLIDLVHTKDPADLEGVDFFIKSPTGIKFPLLIEGFDGQEGVSLDDIGTLNDCLATGGSTCDGLDVSLPPQDILFGDDLVGLDGGAFGLHMQNGNDVLLGDSLPPGFFGTDGLDDISQSGLPPIPPDFFGSGSDPFGNPPPGGIDLFPFEDPVLDGPPLVLPEPAQPATKQVSQAVQDLIAKIIRDNSLEPCEKLVINIRRIRVGNKVSYRISVTRTRDEEACAPKCDIPGGYSSMEDCQNGCEDPTNCGYDGGLCWTCTPVPIFEDGFESGDTSKWSTGDGEAEEEEEEEEEDEDQDQDEDSIVCDKDGGFNSMEACQTSCDGECGYDGGLCWLCAPKVVCPDIAHDSKSACDRACNGDCSQMKDFSGCFLCTPVELEEVPQPGPVEECDSPTITESECRRSCSGTCTKSSTRSDGVKCFECIVDEGPTCTGDNVALCSDCPSATECSSSGDCFTCEPIVDTRSSCPSGTATNESDCSSQCPSDGLCIEEDGCFSCVVVNCPSGTTKGACPESCSNGCEIAGEQHGVQCYQCKQDCETACSSNGYGPENTDHSDAILSELNGYNCVSGASISIQTATIGECNCVGDYSLTVDTTPPVCAGTPCGDIECGGSASCPGGPNETITVNCNWGGWEKIQKHQFRPVVGD